IDTSIFTYTNFRINGNPVNAIFKLRPLVPGSGSSNTNIYFDLDNFFTSDPDGAGGLSDLDGDGFYDDLAAGDTLKFLYDVNAKDMDCSNKSIYMIYHINFDDMCGANHLPKYKTSSTNSNFNVAAWGAASYVPVQIQGNTVFTFEGSYTGGNNISPFKTPNSRYQWMIILPPGMSVASPMNAKYAGNPVTTGVTQIGDTIFYTAPLANSPAGYFDIDLIYNCGVTGNKTIQYKFGMIEDYTNPNACRTLWSRVCGEVTFEVRCLGST